MTQDNEKLTNRWKQHFLKVLNVTSEYRQEVIDDMSLLPPLMELDYPPTAKELSEALSNLKNRRAGRKSGILPELVHCGGCELEDGY